MQARVTCSSQSPGVPLFTVAQQDTSSHPRKGHADDCFQFVLGITLPYETSAVGSWQHMDLHEFNQAFCATHAFRGGRDKPGSVLELYYDPQ